jgi:hypothetical protein
LLEIARRNGVALPADTVDGLAELYRVRDFAHFLLGGVFEGYCDGAQEARELHGVDVRLTNESPREGCQSREVRPCSTTSTGERCLPLPAASRLRWSSLARAPT